MKAVVFGDAVQGYSHIRKEVECQDSLKKVICDDGTIIMAVADGHGSNSCPYSKTGSSIAVNVFCKVMQQLLEGYAEQPEMLLTFLNREGETKVAQAIDAEWKKRVLKIHAKRKREIPLLENGEKDKISVYKQYGSTLIGLMITSEYLFAFQLGDGDIAYVDDSGVDLIIAPEKILGVETHSLSREDAWKKAISVVRRIDTNEIVPSIFALSSDGFSNSHKNEDEYKKTLSDYFSMIKEHGSSVIASNLKGWLRETSEFGCGDDITLLMAYYPKDTLMPSTESEIIVNE